MLSSEKTEDSQREIWMTLDGSAKVENSPNSPRSNISLVLFKMVSLNFAGNKSFLHFILDSFCVNSGSRSRQALMAQNYIPKAILDPFC